VDTDELTDTELTGQLYGFEKAESAAPITKAAPKGKGGRKLVKRADKPAVDIE
jgi:hypothetical protein